ncbi:MAG: helix-turn-helix transcriptional regulator [Rhodobacteraceae bacterium]|nr:helix-turn-helix transcriptional regulator [Paracoccaceae bacterium]
MPELPEPTILSIERDKRERETPAQLDLGARLRALRKDRGWTLAQAAEAVGLARSTLSKIENGQMSPTFEAVRKLASGMGISVPQLFTPPKSGKMLARRSITRAGAGRAHITATYEHEIIAADITHKRMLPYRATVRARAFEDFDGWVRHDGEELLYVLSGEVEFFSEFYEPVRLGVGDSAYYDATMGHNMISTSAEDALVLWVTSQD